MPLIRSSVLEYRALLTISISLNREIISPCSCYAKKGLVYITIISPSSRQPSFTLGILRLILTYHAMYAQCLLISISSFIIIYVAIYITIF